MPRVDVHMQADWHEHHILLKVAFPLSAKNDKATFEIPYGTVERPTTRNTPAEEAQFEVPALRWADLSRLWRRGFHGFSLLNDSKYGYDAKDNVLRLSLLRGPEWPDPNADQGHHEFTYSLYPACGNLARSVDRAPRLRAQLSADGRRPPRSHAGHAAVRAIVLLDAGRQCRHHRHQERRRRQLAHRALLRMGGKERRHTPDAADKQHQQRRRT